MSNFLKKITKPIDKALDSDVFKAVMPVQALAQGAVKLGSGAMGVNNGRGFTPSEQLAIGAGGGSAIAGGAALLGGGPAATPAAAPEAGASPWEGHAMPGRFDAGDDQLAQYHKKEIQLPPAPFGPPQMPQDITPGSKSFFRR